MAKKAPRFDDDLKNKLKNKAFKKAWDELEEFSQYKAMCEELSKNSQSLLIDIPYTESLYLQSKIEQLQESLSKYQKLIGGRG